MAEMIDDFIKRRAPAMSIEFLDQLVADIDGRAPCGKDGNFRYWLNDVQVEIIQDEYRHRLEEPSTQSAVFDWAQDEEFGIDL